MIRLFSRRRLVPWQRRCAREPRHVLGGLACVLALTATHLAAADDSPARDAGAPSKEPAQSRSKDPASKEPGTEEASGKKAASKDGSSKEAPSKSTAKESTAKETTAKERAAKERAAKEPQPKDSSSKETSTKGRSAKPSADKPERAAEPSDTPNLRDELAELATEAAVGPRQGSGQRNVTPEKGQTAAPPSQKSESPSSLPQTDGTTEPASKPRTKPSYQRGPSPKKPQATLPSGTPPPIPDAVARRDIAGGATRDDLKQGTDDPELRALREAERVLFPKPLEGVEAGWSWDLPRPTSSQLNRIAASGLPLDARLQGPPPTAESPEEAAWLKTLALPNLPVRLDSHVVKYLLFYRDNPRGKSIAKVWAKKSGRYIAAMKAEFARAGLPTDLVWMSLIESGHNSTIYSPVGAAGLWQFMPEAGRLYGLTVDRWVDERLDPQRSTEAAIRYLSDLHRRFGNWELAMAAYNMGYAGLSRAVRKFNTNDFWQLARYEAGIPWETTLYVPKIFATAILMNNKKAFGIADVEPEPAITFDTVRVEPGVSLQDVARAAGVAATKIEALNPHYRVARTPPARPGMTVQSWLVRVPLGKGVSVSQRLAKANSDEQLEPYVVRFGDTVAAIAARHRTSEDRLRQINRIGKEEVLAPGTVLLAPGLAAGEIPGAVEGDEVVVVPPRQFAYADRRRVFYRVLPGDTLSRVAQALGVTRAELLSWNALDTSARLQASMVLQAFVPTSTPLDDVRYLDDKTTRVLVAGSDEFFDYFEGLNGRKRLAILVRDGDTFQGLAQRYGISVGMMERINRRSRTDKLKTGETLIVYTERPGSAGKVADTDGLDARPLAPIEPPRPDALPSSEPESPPSDQASNPSSVPGG